ncbi:TetR/AcrR family transcriptional regulator [Glaciibacter superstes]|uniref:TetR/AcrR family transcriptional regulator n=1 Tax=Glaciibacter superstes TaxID=501023 RepID=UPI0003B458A2|nr:TetR/AcrR family transcriptional regulator [Glaciibacter superstes]
MNSDVSLAKRPLRADAQRNYDRILEVALEVFTQSGIQASLDDIACQAGVGPGTLYRHFPNRECLLAAALDESWRGLARTSDDLMTATDAGRALRSWLIEISHHMGVYGGLPDSVAKAFSDDQSPLAPRCSLLGKSTSGLLARAQDAGAVRQDVTADDLLTIANSLAWATDKNGSSQDDVARLLDIFLAGLR